jgi:HYR domain
MTFEGTESFTITGGTGIYVGASGGGEINHVSFGPPEWLGKDTWTGTLVVPGLAFDLTRPVLKGATAKTVRVPKRIKSVRVPFVVTATDDVDGPVPVACEPKSRSWFPMGRTRVRCAATDATGNTGKASFVVTVKRRS